MDMAVVELSRLQFALTALYHFLFVPLTLGLSFILVIMESVYVMTDRPIWRDITRFWGKLFGINFVLGVATGLTKEFEFGTNWSYYSHYVGDIFGAPLAIEGLMAFFLEATFVGLMFFGWDKLSARQHLFTTFMVAVGSNFSALGFLFIAFFATALVLANTGRFNAKWFLRGAVLIIPLPWIAAELGWLVAEIGRQPSWAVDGVLPTFLGASSLTTAQIWTTIAGFTLLYSVLAVIEVRLMLLAIRHGPEGYTPWQPRRDPVPPPVTPNPFHSVPAE